MKAIMYGAGNIGRGFIGALLSEIGYEVVFVDVNDAIVNKINTDKTYPQEIVGPEPKVNWIKNIRAIDGKNTDLVSDEIATADLVATSVGVTVLEKIIPNLANGLTKRWNKNPDNALDILICENLMNADTILHKWIQDALPAKYKPLMETKLGLVETSIGRMVPIMTPEMQKDNILRICVEEYDFLPVDKMAFKTKIPSYNKLVPYSPFGFYLERKLYIHNMAHCMIAFLGKLKNYTYIDEAISDIAIRNLVESAMIESAMAISKKYQIPFEYLKEHIDDLLLRFQNKYLGDTVKRVGREPLRKLSFSDRFVGAVKNCESQDILPLHICLAIACGIYHETKTEPKKILHDICELSNTESLGRYILYLYDKIIENTNDLTHLISIIDTLSSRIRGTIC